MRAGTVGLAVAAGTLAFAAARHDRQGQKRRRRTADGVPVRCRVVVVGAGFGGLEAARALANRPGIELTLIDRHNHHLFQPLLYQVATAALVPTDITAPVRDVVAPAPRVRVVMDTVTGVDTAGRRVLCGEQAFPYDELILATGSQPGYFGHTDWEQAATGLKTLEDALALRRQILSAFEAASATPDTTERDRLLTFVLIGGGPNGVEMAGSIAELGRQMLHENYHLPGARTRVIVVEAGPRVLAEFTPELSDYTVRALHELGVEVRTGTKVTSIEPGLVHTENDTIPAGAIVWTAGTEATPVASWLGVKPGKHGVVTVGPDLLVPGHGPVAVVGDAAQIDGHPLPGLAPVAKQQGRYAARAVLARLRGATGRRPFRYMDYGTLATIGRNRAVAEFGPLKLHGLPAWLAWAGAHIFFLIGFRNRVLVSTQWALAYTLNQRSGRLIPGEALVPPVLAHAAPAKGAAAKPELRPGEVPVPPSPPTDGSQPPVAKPGYSVMPPSTNKVAPVT